MKKDTLTSLLFGLFLLSTGVLFSQSRFVIKDNAYVVLNTAAPGGNQNSRTGTGSTPFLSVVEIR